MPSPKPHPYRQAGVDIAAGDAFAKSIQSDLARTHPPHRAKTTTPISTGGFAGLFDLKTTAMKDPVLVAATDGVGTK